MRILPVSGGYHLVTQGTWHRSARGFRNSEIHYGRPGYRVYYIRRGLSQVTLLTGGDKQSQDQDRGKAHKFARGLELNPS